MRGLLLVNLGTPDAPETAAVRRYLREFLSDPRVIDIAAPLRLLLLECVILPTRPKKSAAAYRKVWGPGGSPLLVHGRALAAAVQTELGSDWKVELGMRYGTPSLGAALVALHAAGVSRIVLLPLYPQYSSAATGSSVEEAFRVASGLQVVPAISVTGSFHDDPRFIDAFAAVGAEVLERERPDHVLMSFHGLPERQIRRADPTASHCLTAPDCCDSAAAAGRGCYRAQCVGTARAIAARLGLAADGWSVAFQSRLGRTPWIRPFTDEDLPRLLAAGKRRVVVFCPAFVADCLETLEEIAIRARADFLAQGGESLTLVPSLNATPAWVAAVAGLARDTAGA
ncbi:MAG: ferrochelatase [Myxococcales bacterium]|nr:ferrochelatase [Myxococcales bacterium]